MASRRRFLAAVAALAGAASCRRWGVSPAAAAVTRPAAPRRLDRIGIQLYSVRGLLERDFDGTLSRLADIGYREVEFAGYFGRSPAAVRAALERSGLASPSTHLDFRALRDETDRVLADAAAIGHAYVTSAWIDASLRRTRAEWSAVAREFDRIGARARSAGLAFAFHNHDYELAPVDGAVPLDILLSETDPALVSLEMDVYWMTKGGADPVDVIRRHPGRCAMLHVKDSAGPPRHEMVNVGAGTIDFARVLRADADGARSIRHVFAEHDQPADAMAFARESFAYLKTLEY